MNTERSTKSTKVSSCTRDDSQHSVAVQRSNTARTRGGTNVEQEGKRNDSEHDRKRQRKINEEMVQATLATKDEDANMELGKRQTRETRKGTHEMDLSHVIRGYETEDVSPYKINWTRSVNMKLCQ